MNVCRGVLMMAVLVSGVTAAEPVKVQSPVAADESLRQMELHPDLRIELVASEPQVIDPVAIAFDEDGRLWVVEMRDYPNGPAPGERPKSRVRLLEDGDGDGFYETAYTFADELLFATGVQPWQGGVIVTMAGEVAWMADTDGDHRADRRQTWFTGFAQENPQLRANHPTFGLDNHIYIANGLRGGTVVAVRPEWTDGAKPVPTRGMDFRFDPLTGRHEVVSGVGQFGLTFDDFGNRFVCSNRNPCKQIVLEDRYLKRNPHLAVASVGHDVSPAGDASHVYPIAPAWTTSTLHAGQFTAACGVTIYRGDALPADFRGNSFTCEPTGSLVHRDVLSPDGATFTSHPGREGVEFLASRDSWFRPVNLAQGPDGALYVVDMYRAVIEHPQFMPSELKERPDLYHGNDRGRLYRITARDAGNLSARRKVRLSQATTADLVARLDHPDAWHRTTAQRLLIERQDRAAIEPLEHLARHGKTPQGRVHALWTLHGLGGLTDDLRAAAVDDPSARVAEQAIRLCEGDADALGTVCGRAKGDDTRLQFQAALSLGEIADAAAITEPLARIALHNVDDPWVRTAVLCSTHADPIALLGELLPHLATGKEAASKPQADLAGELAELIGSRQQDAEIASALTRLTAWSFDPETKSAERLRIAEAGIEGLGRGLARRGKGLTAHVAKLDDEPRERVRQVFGQAAAAATNADQSAARRAAAIGLLRYADAATAVPALEKVVGGDADQSLRVAAIDVLSRFSDPQIGPLLVRGYAMQTPAVRRAVLDALLTRPERVKLLLDEIEAKHIAASELGPVRERRLTQHPDAALRARAVKLLAAATPADRRAVLERYQAALSLPADANRGRAIFAKNCTACHRIGELGVNVAPDIGDSRTRHPAALLTDILDPNRAIDNNYLSYTVVTTEGQIHNGVIAGETATSITLKQPEGKTLTLLREDVDALRSDGISLMPVGLEKNIPVQEMADLIAFIKNWRYLESGVPARTK